MGDSCCPTSRLPQKRVLGGPIAGSCTDLGYSRCLAGILLSHKVSPFEEFMLATTGEHIANQLVACVASRNSRDLPSSKGPQQQSLVELSGTKRKESFATT